VATEGFASASNIISALSLLVSAGSIGYSLWVNRRNGEVSLSARQAEERSEEALSVAKATAALAQNRDMRDAARFKTEEAQRKASALAASWSSQLIRKRGSALRFHGEPSFSLRLDVTDADAAPFAVDILKAQAKDIWLVDIRLATDKKSVTIVGYTIHGARGAGLTS
jgi:hypothetical protein